MGFSGVVVIIKFKHNTNITEHFNSFLVIQTNPNTVSISSNNYLIGRHITNIINGKKICYFAPDIWNGFIVQIRLANLLYCTRDYSII